MVICVSSDTHPHDPTEVKTRQVQFVTLRLIDVNKSCSPVKHRLTSGKHVPGYFHSSQFINSWEIIKTPFFFLWCLKIETKILDLHQLLSWSMTPLLLLSKPVVFFIICSSWLGMKYVMSLKALISTLLYEIQLIIRVHKRSKCAFFLWTDGFGAETYDTVGGSGSGSGSRTETVIFCCFLQRRTPETNLSCPIKTTEVSQMKYFGQVIRYRVVCSNLFYIWFDSLSVSSAAGCCATFPGCSLAVSVCCFRVEQVEFRGFPAFVSESSCLLQPKTTQWKRWEGTTTVKLNNELKTLFKAS